MHSPSEVHWKALKRVLRYLQGTLQFALHIQRGNDFNLHMYSNADWAGDSTSSLNQHFSKIWLSILGLDSITPFTSNYKVLWVRRFIDYDDTIHRSYGAIYSSSTNSWRILKCKHHKDLTSALSIASLPYCSGYLNGAYYWIVRENTLLSFDLGNEVFHENSSPDVPGLHFTSLILRDGSINIMAKDFNSVFTLWLMIEPGVWNKLRTFQCTSLIEPIYHGSWDSTLSFSLIRVVGSSPTML
ncbi:hypothetical protein CQW23_13351 [Capsicum baccatum]|uniref:F-box associated beta-propeller type 1 domain-containing protein n=1 Tax=Capsicum baccatum TaxID=33114 RepID=A0A2G2WV81_CAPBA|nr:hypothetical protein CQW23_13351 [Capsicum baccatum]